MWPGTAQRPPFDHCVLHWGQLVPSFTLCIVCYVEFSWQEGPALVSRWAGILSWAGTDISCGGMFGTICFAGYI